VQKYQNNILNTSGDVMPGATITVTTLAGSSAALYSDNGVTALGSNVVTTNATGEFSFYAANGHYNLTVSGAGITTHTISDVILSDVTVAGAASKVPGTYADGIHDDSAAINAAIALGNVDFGGTENVYLVNSTITLLSNRTLTGHGATITGAVYLFVSQQNTVSAIAENITVSGLSIIATGTGNWNCTCIAFINCPTVRNILIENNILTSGSGYNQVIQGGVGSYQPGGNAYGATNTIGQDHHDITIRNNKITSTAAGIEWSNAITAANGGNANGFYNIKVHDNVISASAHVVNASNDSLGISLVGPSRGFSIKGNRVFNYLNIGIEVFTGDTGSVFTGHVIDGNFVENTGSGTSWSNNYSISKAFAGQNTEVDRMNGITFVNNISRNATMMDIFSGLTNCTFSNNTFYYDSSANGITAPSPVQFYNVDHTLISGNRFTYINAALGSEFSTEFNNVRDCKIVDNIFDCSLNTCTSNVVKTGNTSQPPPYGDYFKNNTFSNNLMVANAVQIWGLNFNGASSAYNTGTGNVIETTNAGIIAVQQRNGWETQVNNDLQVWVNTGATWINKVSNSYVVTEINVDASGKHDLAPVQILTGAMYAPFTFKLPKTPKPYTVINNSGQICTVTTGSGAEVTILNAGSHSVYVDNSGNIYRSDVVIPESKVTGTYADGINDDTAVLQLAATLGSVNFGGAENTYLITGPIGVYSNHNLIGSGATIISSGAVLVSQGGFVGAIAENIIISGLNLVSTNVGIQSSIALSFSECPTIRNVLIENNTFTTSGYNRGIHGGVEGYQGGTNTIGQDHHDITIRNNHFNTTAAGINWINGIGVSNGATPNGMYNINIIDNTFVAKSKIVNAASDSNGIKLSGQGRNWAVKNNKISNFLNAGISIFSGATGNYFTNHIIDGNFVDNTGDAAYGHNYSFVDYSGAQVAEADKLTGIIFTNNISKNAMQGDYFYEISGCLFTNNTFYSDTNLNGTGAVSPLDMIWADNCTFHKNKIILINAISSVDFVPKFSYVRDCIFTDNIFDSSGNVAASSVVKVGNGSIDYFKANIFSNNKLLANAAQLYGIDFNSQNSSYNTGIGNIIETSNAGIIAVRETGGGGSQINNDLQIWVNTGSTWLNKDYTSRVITASLDISAKTDLTSVQILTGTMGAGFTLTIPKTPKQYTIKNSSGQTCTVTTGAGATVSITASSRQDIYVDTSGSVIGL